MNCNKFVDNGDAIGNLISERVFLIGKVLGVKAKEYVRSGDRLYNFKRAGVISQQHWAGAAWGMALKHLVSVCDIIDGWDVKSDGVVVTEEMIREKFGDLINYLVLIEAGIIFEIGKDNNVK